MDGSTYRYRTKMSRLKHESTHLDEIANWKYRSTVKWFDLSILYHKDEEAILQEADYLATILSQTIRSIARCLPFENTKLHLFSYEPDSKNEFDLTPGEVMVEVFLIYE